MRGVTADRNDTAYLFDLPVTGVAVSFVITTDSVSTQLTFIMFQIMIGKEDAFLTLRVKFLYG